MKELTKISIVVPVYNSSEVLYELKKQVDNTFADLKLAYQLILVDDCSHDNSWQIIKAIKQADPANIVAVRLAKNFGQHNAIFCGLQYCTGEVTITMDDDLQSPPSEIKHLVNHWQKTGADVVYGISDDYKKSTFRKLASRSAKTATKLTSSAIGEGSSFRLLSSEIVKKFVTHKQYFIFLDELISWYSSNVEFVLVKHEHSKVKKSRYTVSKLFKLYFELIIGYNAAPLKFITFLGLSSSFISFLVGTLFIIKKLFWHVRIGFTGIIVSIAFSAGVILLSIGIIGEHLRRMYNILNAQPQYFVSEVLD